MIEIQPRARARDPKAAVLATREWIEAELEIMGE